MVQPRACEVNENRLIQVKATPSFVSHLSHDPLPATLFPRRHPYPKGCCKALLLSVTTSDGPVPICGNQLVIVRSGSISVCYTIP
jgi:hypothetical protein